jgi:dienelactone hydrolase
MQGELIEYRDGDCVMEGYLVRPVGASGNVPCILLCHDWSGLNRSTRDAAHRFSALGYATFALDAYGKGLRGDERGDNSVLMNPMMEDRALLCDRLLAGVMTARRFDGIDADRMAAVGYCFGGLCALDIVRAGAAGVKAAVTFHGGLKPPGLGKQPPISARVLLLHGWSDPIVPPETVVAVAQELTDAGADWEMHAYGNVMHAFTFQDANLPEFGVLYDRAAATKAWAAARSFLEKTIGTAS